MSAWTFLYIYLAGAALLALRLAWHIRYRLDKYDRMFCDVRSTFWFDVILWPLLLLKPDNLINPKFPEKPWSKGRAEAERERDRLETNPPPCSKRSKRGQTRLSAAIFPAAVSPSPTFFVIPTFMPFSLREDEVDLAPN